ncbi:MAG: hypothetical protein RID07_07655, partial [Lacipirellulaceae bacterium]
MLDERHRYFHYVMLGYASELGPAIAFVSSRHADTVKATVHQQRVVFGYPPPEATQSSSVLPRRVL